MMRQGSPQLLRSRTGVLTRVETAPLRDLTSAIAPRALIMLNGAEDSLVPRRYALTLYGAAREPKELVWVEGEHIQPSESALIERLSSLVTGRLVAHGLLW